ncbi:cysteine peptidase C11 family protein [Balneicella halophila]|uniref:Cysteine peptidase C11 family protein n=1 Tax=Balneicella halophila TaxID=1537566 RepID=A0A7L4UMV6_BALHA|nr:clostripain-related cysteine peptidase [Balneicella halophila]PVX49872.1 cysteine peptidase C11 family protein [Balneicella halophila]
MKKLFLYFIFALFLFTSCDDSDHPDVPEIENRTVIFYMIGDNSLSRFIDVNLSELQEGLTESGLNDGHLVLYIDDKGGKPKVLELKVVDGTVTKEVVMTYDEHDSTDPAVMKGVINDIKTEFAATKYGLVLWSHATAWMPKNADNMISTRSFGDDYGQEMDINVLADALSSFHFDFILFDACYMASIEVAYELRDVADYLIASPMEVMAKGFPYELIVNKFFTIPNADLQGIARDFYNHYNSQEGDYRTASVVLADMSKIEKIASSMQTIMDKYKPQLSQVNLDEVQATEHLYFGEELSILYDLDDYVRVLTIDDASTADYMAFQDALNDAILYEAHTPFSYFAESGYSFEIKKCSGFSIYPLGFHPELDSWYEKLEWYQAVYQ